MNTVTFTGTGGLGLQYLRVNEFRVGGTTVFQTQIPFHSGINTQRSRGLF